MHFSCFSPITLYLTVYTEYITLLKATQLFPMLAGCVTILYDDWHVASCIVVATARAAMLPLLMPALVIRNQVLSVEISGVYLMLALAG